MMEKFNGSINVEFKGMPSIRLESFKPADDVGMLERLAIATRRRRFSLLNNWSLVLNKIDHSDDLNGIIEIPSKDGNKETIVFDGASIPMPWLVSLLTIGILRPLGVMLIGSIVHDYAYKFGSLRVSKDGVVFKDVQLSRLRADHLFRDIVGTVNEFPSVGFIACFFVRIGWIWVRYDGKHFGGNPPIAEYSLLFFVLCGLWWLYSVIGLGSWIILFSGIYVVLYVASTVIGRKRSRET